MGCGGNQDAFVRLVKDQGVFIPRHKAFDTHGKHAHDTVGARPGLRRMN